jgi:hypothetical protein
MKYGGLIELLVVLMFAVGWGVWELVALRERSAGNSRHAERK